VKHPKGFVEKLKDRRLKPKFEDIILRDEWKLQDTGALILVNKKIIAAQDSVLSFIMSTLKKNIFSKGPLQISLPVTIFNSNSQLSQYAQAMSAAPDYLEAAAKLTDPIERMKRVMVAGFSNSVLFLDIEKPFNPILG
jgi:hypothetical protein